MTKHPVKGYHLKGCHLRHVEGSNHLVCCSMVATHQTPLHVFAHAVAVGCHNRRVLYTTKADNGVRTLTLYWQSTISTPRLLGEEW